MWSQELALRFSCCSLCYSLLVFSMDDSIVKDMSCSKPGVCHEAHIYCVTSRQILALRNWIISENHLSLASRSSKLFPSHYCSCVCFSLWQFLSNAAEICTACNLQWLRIFLMGCGVCSRSDRLTCTWPVTTAFVAFFPATGCKTHF